MTDSGAVTNLERTVRHHPSAVLLVAQLVGLLTYPFASDDVVIRAILGVFGTAIVLIALWAVRRSPGMRRMGMILGPPAIVFSILEAIYLGTDWVVLTSALLHAPFYVYVSYGLIRYLVHDHIVTRAIRHCGGEPLFADRRVLVPEIGREALIEARPDVILAAAPDDDWQQAWQDDTLLPAVREGHLYTLDPDAISRPGPRLIQGVEQVCRALERATRPS